MTVVRYALGVALSAACNAGLIFGLARLDRPVQDEDHHAAHRVRPSVVKPPPPTDTAADAPATEAAPTPLPATPPSPQLDLPAPGNLVDGPSLAGDGLQDIGLDGLEGLTARGGPAAPPGPERPPQLTAPPDLAGFYPKAARRRNLGGRSIVAIDVDARGRVVAAEVLRSEPPGIFERAAVRAARTFRFEPAERGGKPVAARTRLELKWQPRKSR